MKEVEILVNVFDGKEVVLESLKRFDFAGIKKTADVYFYDPLRSNLKPAENYRLTESCRIRQKDKKSLLAYKVDHFDESGKWIFSDEHEVEISDFETGLTIMRHIGLLPLIKLEIEKHTFLSEKYEIVLEDVKNLGLFLEVEALSVSEEDSVAEIKSEIFKFIDSLKIKVSKELNAGKPELMLRKLKHHI